MDFLKYFTEFLNENDGFGNSYFHEKKIDKDYCYFFKTGITYCFLNTSGKIYMLFILVVWAGSNES